MKEASTYSHPARTLVAAAMMILIMATALTAAEPVLIGKGVDAKWSPVKELLSYIRLDSLFVVTGESGSQPICVNVGPILRYEWLNDSCLLVQQRHQQERLEGLLITDRICRVSLDGNQSEVASDSGIVGRDNPRRLAVTKLANGDVGYFDNASGQEIFIQQSASISRPDVHASGGYWVTAGGVGAPWGKVWLVSQADGSSRQVTRSENDYVLPQLSPTNDRFFCFAARGDLVVFDTLGNELGNLGRVEWPTWSSDGEWIAFCATQYTEFDIAGSDVGIARFDGTQRRLLTNTANAMEVEPVFSPNAKRLIYRDYGSGNLAVVDTEIQ